MSEPVLRATAMASPVRSIPDSGAWQQWLADQIDSGWRPEEWNADLWLFTGDPDNPRTALWPCGVTACEQIVNGGRMWTRLRRVKMDPPLLVVDVYSLVLVAVGTRPRSLSLRR